MESKPCFALLVALVVAGCGDDGGAAPEPQAGGAGGAGAAAAGQGGGGAAGDPGPTAGAQAGAPAGGAGSSPDESELVALPEGSRQYEHILNLVLPEAKTAVAEFLQLPDGRELTEEERKDLSLPSRMFYTGYRSEYDFLVFISDTAIEADAGGRHQAVHTETIPGTGVRRYYAQDFGDSGHLVSAIAMNFEGLDVRPPFAHEVAHRWANHLDESLGFGDAFEGSLAAHWGSVGVHGQLGGFDAATLRCKTPAGAVPPACTPETNGRVHYVVGRFSPVSSPDPERAYAPLELYMMGLASVDELPASFTLLEDAEPEPIAVDPTTGDETVDAAGVREIQLADIVALHGPRIPLPEAERHYRMAVVVVSDTPASDEILAAASRWAESFGGYVSLPPWKSFEELTGGRATMDTRLGPRRRLDDPPDEVPDRPMGGCDVLLQDCDAGSGCYDPDVPVCLPSGGAALAAPCVDDEDCAPGLGCDTVGATPLCSPYCDPADDTAALACAALCPGAFAEFVALEGMSFVTVGAQCFAGSGTGTCDPLAQDCAGGLGCYGRESTTCQAAGSTAQGQTCFPLGAVCEPGSECVGIQGMDSFCQPYCDPNGTGANACSTLCPGGSWEYGSYSICIP
jgi:hypothetical protein